MAFFTDLHSEEKNEINVKREFYWLFLQFFFLFSDCNLSSATENNTSAR